MSDPRHEYYKSILDSRYYEQEGVSDPLCGLIKPEEAPGDSFTCPKCGTTWIKITQFGKTVWSTHELNDGQPIPEGSGP